MNQGGTFSAIWSISGTLLFGDSFTSDQGVWKKTDTREITATAVSFDYLPPSDTDPVGVVLANTRSDWVITFGAEGISGTVQVTGYGTDVNPLKPGAAVPIFAVSGTFQGEAF